MARPAIYIKITANSDGYSCQFVTTQYKSVAALKRVRRSFQKTKQLIGHRAGELVVTTENLGRHTKKPVIN